MQATLKLSVDTLSWAAAANGFSLSDFAHYLYKTEQTAQNITEGKLTIEQVKNFLKKLTYLSVFYF